MTLSLTDIADYLRVVWFALGLAWIGYAWLNRVPYRRAMLVLLGLIVLDLVLHAFSAFAEQPNSDIPSDFPLYSLVLLLAAIVGLANAYWYARRAGLAADVILDAALVVVIAGGVGARAYHVWMRWDYYSQNGDDITNLAQGGMGLRGGLALGVAALFVYALVRRVDFWKLADAGALGLCVAQSIGWYGAYLTAVNYGIVSDASIAQDLPDLYGIIQPRIPVQLIASIFFAVLWFALLVLARRTRMAAGWLALTYLIVASLAGFILGYVRGDETMFWGALRADQWVDLALLTLGLILAGLRLWREPRFASPAQAAGGKA